MISEIYTIFKFYLFGIGIKSEWFIILFQTMFNVFTIQFFLNIFDKVYYLTYIII